VYLSPADDPLYGIPIGDGCTGCLIWPEKDRLVLSVNHTDLWDMRGKESEFKNWSKEEEEYSTSLRHAGRLELRFDAPIFDLLYQKNYEARLSLADAKLELRAETPFSKVRINAFASNEAAVTVLTCEADFQDSAAPSVFLERWGSRTFGHWYSQICRDPSIGLGGTQTCAEDGIVYITQQLETQSFCFAAAVESALPFTAKRFHNRAGGFSFKNAGLFGFCVYLTVALSDTTENARLETEKRLKNAVRLGGEELLKRHANAWNAVWKRAFVSLQDDYIENLWYLNLYYANSQMRGKYPPHFCNGIWGFGRDFVPWNYYFHYNMQLGYWPLLPANQPELLKPYLNFRFDQLPFALRFALKRKGVRGALYTDVSSANGACDANTQHNLTPGAQIAQTFWLYYRYTGDREFLKEKAWPVIRETAMLYANLVERGEDGFYHLFASQAYEASPMMDDTITDHAAMRAVFQIAAECMNELEKHGASDVRENFQALWSDILLHLAPFRTVGLEEDEYYERGGQRFIAAGVGKDKPVKYCVAPVTGVYRADERGGEAALEDREYWDSVPKGTLMRTTFNSKHRKPYYGFPTAEFSVVVPSGIIGLKDRGSELFEALVNILRLEKRTFIEGQQLELDGKDDVSNMGWYINMIALARLGLSAELRDTVSDAIEAWQWYPNGLGHYGGYRQFIPESNLRFYRRVVTDTQNPSVKIPFPAWPFRHFDYETLPIIAAAVNEMLLQSYENRIRLFPACPADYSGAFQLAAEGGFEVQSQIENGKVLFAEIKAARDGAIRLVDPWGEKRLYASRITPEGIVSGEYIKTARDMADDVAELEIGAGERVLFTRRETELPENPPPNPAHKGKNTSSKQFGRSRLGIPQMF
jgi:hypothetical protein